MATLLGRYLAFLLVLSVVTNPVAASTAEKATNRLENAAAQWERLDTISHERGKSAADTAFKRYSDDEQAAITEFLGYVEVGTEQFDENPPEDPASVSQLAMLPGAGIGKFNSSHLVDGCYGPYYKSIYGASSITGTVFWRFYQQFQFCVQGLAVSWGWCSSGPVSSAYGWEWKGFVAYCRVTYGGVGTSSIKYHSQGHFCSQLPGWGCTSNRYPWIDQQGDYRGYYWAWWGA